jgi:Zn-dependent alcohol dehydrogenase
MRALVVSSLEPNYGGAAVQWVRVPRPRAGEVLVKVKAASVNFPDLLMTRGEYQLKPPLPFGVGMELAGEVVAIGEGIEGLSLGDAVVGGSRLGAFAEYAVLGKDSAKPKPAALSFAQASAYGVAYLTAYVALVRRARLEPGEWVLVHGAAGGGGLAAVDLAKGFSYKGMMYSDVPNMASTFGYTNASWTLKADLTCGYVVRHLNHMTATGLRQCTPVRRPGDEGSEDWLDFSSGYVQRSVHLFPKQGAKEPWKQHQNYALDLMALKFGKVEDGAMIFSNPMSARSPAAA